VERISRPTLLLTAVVLGVGALLLVGDRYASHTLSAAVGAASVATFSTAAAVAAIRYVRGRDPHALFVTVGAAVIACVGLLAVIWSAGEVSRVSASAISGGFVAVEPSDVGDAVPVTTWMGAWAIAAVLFVFAVPWRERRGRPPVRPSLVIAGTSAVTVAVVASVAIGLRTTSVGIEGDTHPGAIAVGLACVAAIGLVVAGARELRAPSSSAPHPQLAIAWLVGVLVPVAQIQGVTFGLGLVRWIDVATIVVPAAILAGLMAAETSEATRLRRSSDRAEEVLGGRAEIASMVAHEVRGPVASVKGLAATTAGSYDRLSDDERREFVGLIEEEASRLLGVVDQTSLALKIDARTLTMDRRPHDLAAVVREGLAGADVGEHPLSTELAEGLVAPVDRRWIAIAVRQVVDNAARFSPAIAPIDLSLRTDSTSAVIEVADRGPGVPPERRTEVFGRFARWRPTGYEDRQGSGLGLFICRGILAEHGGEVSLADRPGGGTMLRLTLPLERPMEG
jgi:signal transduction histidine kinase